MSDVLIGIVQVGNKIWTLSQSLHSIDKMLLDERNLPETIEGTI
ncbi:hypothetical protein A3Q56_00839 [Intoshia linei]|uniref:Uncharacterized protein n=1 Tax=Intoshia linei TaxID=1819745 RepID=A0A177BAP5_9BILA|nr:hypothetical protein A3Q56_00839 [Intoshia linei]